MSLTDVLGYLWQIDMQNICDKLICKYPRPQLVTQLLGTANTLPTIVTGTVRMQESKRFEWLLKMKMNIFPIQLHALCQFYPQIPGESWTPVTNSFREWGSAKEWTTVLLEFVSSSRASGQNLIYKIKLYSTLERTCLLKKQKTNKPRMSTML